VFPGLTHLEQTAASRTDGYGVVWFRTVAGLWCEECLLLADDTAAGWRLVRTDIPDEDEEPMLAAYCPVCRRGSLAWSAVSTQARQACRGANGGVWADSS
jgi:hypothetical protein